MKINEKLKKSAEFNPTKKSHQMSINDMCAHIEKHLISLPLYQRDLSWTLQKSINLLNYQLLGKAPVSPISFNIILNTDNCVPQISFIDREIIEQVQRGQYSVVDGQQRLTTNFKAYINDESFKNIVLDLSRGYFIEQKNALKSYQIPVGILLNKEDNELFKYIKNKTFLKKDECITLLLQIRSKIKNYNYTINQAEELTEDEQIEWFEVLNNAGSRVSIIQMRFSKLKAHGIDVYTQFTKKFQTKLTEYGCGHFFTPQQTVVSYPISALNPAYEYVIDKKHKNNYAPIPSDTKENKLCEMLPEDLKKCFELTLQALDLTLNFIDENNLKKPKRIDYINYLIGYFINNNNETITEQQKNFLTEWYNNIDFTNKSNSIRREIYNDLIQNI